MRDIDDIVTALRNAPDDKTCRKAAELIARLQQQLEELRKADSRYMNKMERNRTILQRRTAGERTKDLAAEYGVTSPKISRICQQERERLRREKAK